jgi:hypothetical protein
MEELTLNDQVVVFDREATVSSYDSIEQGDADRCTCSNCQNFTRFRDVAYGPKLVALLERLGIDRFKESEAFLCGAEVDGRLPYAGWFPFVGEWSPNRTGKDAFDFPKQEEFFFFTKAYPKAIKLFGPRALAVEFTVWVPGAPGFMPHPRSPAHT